MPGTISPQTWMIGSLPSGTVTIIAASLGLERVLVSAVGTLVSARNLSLRQVSDKIVRLLWRVAGVHRTLTPESRFLREEGAGVCPHRTRRPDQPGRCSGRHHNKHTDPGLC